jgi:hypothetical protein
MLSMNFPDYGMENALKIFRSAAQDAMRSFQANLFILMASNARVYEVRDQNI